MNQKIEIVEEYNQEGVCVRRTANGIELPADTEPSAVIFMDVSSLTQKFYMTPEEAKHRFPEYFNAPLS